MSKNIVSIDLAALAGALTVTVQAYTAAIVRAFKTNHPDPKTPVSVARIATGVAGLAADLTVGTTEVPVDFMLVRDEVGCTLTADGKPLLPGSICRAKGIETPYAQRVTPLKDADVPPEHREAVSRLRRLLHAAARELAEAGYRRAWKNEKGVDVAAEVAAARSATRAEVVGPTSALMGYGRFARKAAPAAAASEARFAGWAVSVPADAPKAKGKKARA